MMKTTSDVYYDPYDVDIDADPYPVFRRLREEAPLYYNEPHDFYALSRFADVERALLDPQTFISGRGGILELIKANIEMPPGVLIFEDPPVHTVHRSLLSRVFTPRRVAALEPQIRAFCARSLDPLVGAGAVRLHRRPGRADADAASSACCSASQRRTRRPSATASTPTFGPSPGQPMQVSENFVDGEMFAEYIDWRAEHPSDDIMTELLNAEFEDETGTLRRLTREELLTYVDGHRRGGQRDHDPAHRMDRQGAGRSPRPTAELVEDPSLIPNAIEELLRFEPPAPHVAGTWPGTSSSTARPCRRGASCCSFTDQRTGTIAATPTVTPSTSTGRSASPSPSDSASIFASGRRSPAWKAG